MFSPPKKSLLIIIKGHRNPVNEEYKSLLTKGVEELIIRKRENIGNNAMTKTVAYPEHCSEPAMV
jgi:hypothetical protein